MSERFLIMRRTDTYGSTKNHINLDEQFQVIRVYSDYNEAVSVAKEFQVAYPGRRYFIAKVMVSIGETIVVDAPASFNSKPASNRLSLSQE